MLAHLENARSLYVAPLMALQGAPASQSADDEFFQLIKAELPFLPWMLLLLPSSNAGARDCTLEPRAHSCCCSVGRWLHCWNGPGLDIGHYGPACPSLLLGVMLMSPSRKG